ncbi:response regulator [Vibrio zhugei]|uniref:Response regulator n=1 Tax=Vibrio zhugei TaxID=2479546 RepID=A0ABV7C6X6_9VIBR|nr:response regulator [Vibrio zhugei]
MYKADVRLEAETAIQTDPETAQSKIIMLVDDDPIFRHMMRASLVSQGYEVVEAENGLEGLRQLSVRCPDLILCDLSMPVLNGMEFVEEVSLEYPTVPLLVVSATEDMSEVAKALRFGIKDFLPKPIRDHEHLYGAIENTLADSSRHQTDQRDLANQWYRADDQVSASEERDLYWHLDYLRNHPNAARGLLQALLPDNDSAQGAWHCSYRLLQSTDHMPLIFDYSWLINGQMMFYLVDSNSDTDNGVGTTLLIRAMFYDYLRNTRNLSVDLKDFAELVERGIKCTDHMVPVSAMFGLVNFNDGTVSILPAGLSGRWSNVNKQVNVSGEVLLGNNCLKNFMITELQLKTACKLSLSAIGSSNFVLDIYKNDKR